VYGLGLITPGLFPNPTTADASYGQNPDEASGPIPILPLPLPIDLLPPGEEGPIPMPALPLPAELGPAPARGASSSGAFPMRTPMAPPAPASATTPAPTLGTPSPGGNFSVPQIFQKPIQGLRQFPWKWVLLIGGAYLLYEEFGKRGRRR